MVKLFNLQKQNKNYVKITFLPQHRYSIFGSIKFPVSNCPPSLWRQWFQLHTVIAILFMFIRQSVNMRSWTFVALFIVKKNNAHQQLAYDLAETRKVFFFDRYQRSGRVTVYIL